MLDEAMKWKLPGLDKRPRITKRKINQIPEMSVQEMYEGLPGKEVAMSFPVFWLREGESFDEAYMKWLKLG